ncbi:MAG: hypothetical protein AB8G99_17635, partial [Planctomycetaceae bacterium]
ATIVELKICSTFKLPIQKQKTADESEADWVFLGKPNFYSLSLNSPSVWGRNASGDAIARRGESDSIAGTWSIEGKERQWATEIALTPIMALATELTLTLPSTLRLETDGAFSSKGQPSATETTWNVILNERSPTRLRIVKPGRFMRPPIVDVRSSWSLRKDTTQLRAEINLQTSSSVTEFSIQLPTATTIESVLYGDNTPVPISVSDHSEGRRLKVTLPRPIEGPGRRLVLTARLPVVVDDKWTVPDFSTIRCSTTNNALVEAIARRITHSVFIAAPLELQELSLSGFKQSNNVFQEDGSQTLSLIRIFEDGEATLRIGEAKRTRRYHVATKLLTNQTSWEQKTLIISDTAFPREIRLRIPSNLTVFSVSSGPERTPCDFQIDPTSPQSARVFIPTTNNKVIEVIGQTDNLPTETVSPLDGITNTNLVVVSQDNLRLKDKSIRTVPLRQFRSDFGMYAGAGFAGPDTAIIECEPGEVVALKSEKRITVKPDSTEELTKPKELSTAIVSSMQLTSRIRNRPDADLHEARIEVSTNDSIVKFQLRKSAKIVSVSTNGIAQRPDRRGETVLVPINSATKTNLLVIRYSCSNGGESLLDTNRTIPVPKFNQARDFTWQIMSAPDLKVVSTHPFGQQPQQSEGLSQLLGPLRSATANEEPGVVTMPYVPQELSITLASKSSHQHMQWIALAGTALLSLLLVVRIKPIWLCGIEAVLALLSVVLPSPIGPICGSCFLGGLFGLAIANLFKSTSSNRVTRHSKSGLSRPSAVAGLLIIAAVATTANAFGQETTSELPRVYDIPDQDTVYVDRDFLKQLDRQEPAASNLLVQEAQYVVSIANGSIAVRARFEALQMHKNRSTIVRFPFARGNVSRCRLNGEAVDFDRTGEYVELTIPSTESTGPEPPTIIELELYPPMTNGGFRLPIAPAAKSTCEVQSEDAVESWLNGVVVEPNAITPVTTEIALELKSQNADTQDIPATISSDCAIEVGTSEVAFDHTVVITPGSNPVEDLTLRFPADQKFSSLVTDRPAIQQIVSTGSTTYAVISFREPLLVPTSIRLKLSKVMKSISTDRVLRLEPVVDGLSSVTVQSQPGLRIKNVRWMDNTDTNAVPIRTNNDRSAAFSIDTPGRMKFRIEAADAIRDLRLIQQVHIRETELEYELTGDMDITDGPVFSHTLNVSPDLRIESVMVRENDVDRLARYQREGDLLLLLLEGRTS